jgi:hypothetical protein
MRAGGLQFSHGLLIGAAPEAVAGDGYDDSVDEYPIQAEYSANERISETPVLCRSREAVFFKGFQPLIPPKTLSTHPTVGTFVGMLFHNGA